MEVILPQGIEVRVQIVSDSMAKQGRFHRYIPSVGSFYASIRLLDIRKDRGQRSRTFSQQNPPFGVICDQHGVQEFRLPLDLEEVQR